MRALEKPLVVLVVGPYLLSKDYYLESVFFRALKLKLFAEYNGV